jgi:hypothetical protein
MKTYIVVLHIGQTCIGAIGPFKSAEEAGAYADSRNKTQQGVIVGSVHIMDRPIKEDQHGNQNQSR